MSICSNIQAHHFQSCTHNDFNPTRFIKHNMNANVKDRLAQLDKIYKAFTHRGSIMTKKQSKEVLEYAVSKGYKNIYDIPDVEIDKIISK